MKLTVLILSLFFLTPVIAQKSPQNPTDSIGQDSLPFFKNREPVGYILNKQEFTFTPEMGGIRIDKIQDEESVDYGDLRRTTPDGFYIMTSTINDDVSFGRFDTLGNFRAFRYDREKDTVVEEEYQIQLDVEKKP